MSEINLEDVTEFAKIKDIWNECFYDREGLQEFLNNVVMNIDKKCCNGYGHISPNYLDVYVLVSNNDFPFYKLTTHNKISIDLSVVTTKFVIGYMWLCPFVSSEEYVTCHFIDFVNSRISGLNIVKYMIKKYEEQWDDVTHLFPFEILFGAKLYWKKYFINTYNIKNKTDLLQLISEFNLTKKNINWKELILEFEM